MANHDDHDGGAPHDGEVMDDCPICYGELGHPTPICPNGHKVCDICRPHILRQEWVGGRPPLCPICRTNLTEVAVAEGFRQARVPRPAGVGAAGGGRPRPDAEMREEGARLARNWHMNVGGFDAIGRHGGGRPHNGPAWNDARELFLRQREAGVIPPNSVFGGIHARKCGHRGCVRWGGHMGVRFLLYGVTGKRRYRCEEHTENHIYLNLP